MRSNKYNKYNQASGRSAASERVKNRRAKAKSSADKKRITKLIMIGVAIVLFIVLICLIRYCAIYLIESHSDTELKGVDVSSYQQEIDWEGLKDEGFVFAYAKATEGSTHVDPRFEEYWHDARKTGFKTGAYHFLSFDTNGKKQAKNFIKTVPKKCNALPPVVDVEMYGDYESSPPSQKKLDKHLKPVLEKLEKKYHKKPIIYTNPYVYNKYISGKYDGYKIWISDHSIPESLPDGKAWTFCQYTFSGTSQYVAGGQAEFDCNLYYGTKWDLRKLQ